MENSFKIYSREELNTFSLEKLKDIARVYNLKTSRPKGILVRNILATQDKNKRGSYLIGKGKYQQNYDRYLEKFATQDNSLANFFNISQKIYEDYFLLGMKFGETLSSAYYSLPEIYYQFIAVQRPYNSESMEIFMDAVIQKVKQDTKYFNSRKRILTEELTSFKNPKYIELTLSYEEIEELAEIQSIAEINQFFSTNGIKTQANTGDIIGAKMPTTEGALPNLIGYLQPIYRKDDPVFDRIFINYYEEENFEKTGKYPLPESLRDADREELEAIYHFPFLNFDREKL